MADTFFGFDALNSDHISSPDEVDCLEGGEEEYDLLNDETFGTLQDDTSGFDDWEQQHEQLAEIEESNKKAEQIENSLNQLVTEDDENDFDYEANWCNPDLISIKESVDFVCNLFPSKEDRRSRGPSKTNNNRGSQPMPPQQGPSAVKNIRTVEELERSLLTSRFSNQPHQKTPVPAPPQIQPQFHGPPIFQGHPLHSGRLPPPGLHHPIGLPPPPIRPGMHHPNLPPGLIGVVPPPPFMRGHPNLPPHPPPGLVFPGNAQFPHNHQFNYSQMPRHPNLQQHVQHTGNHQQQQQQQQQQQKKNNPDANSNYHRQKNDTNEIRDEYAGLMTHREKQWLLNIQLLQLNTGTPYFDDYYYTVFKERKAKTDKENQPLERNHRYQHNNKQHGHHRNNDMQENANQLTPRVYTPLQFENSLGKLQCGSVTAPRKIIDMDVVTLDKETENSNTITRDTRKTKQLLLELEALYSLVLKAEDLKNPVAISNTDKLRQLKQKQRLRELEAASTPEQKQEILKLIQKESVPIVENQQDYLVKILGAFLQEDKFNSFMNIRKGKMLLLRLLPLLTMETFRQQISELWMRVLLSVPLVGRRDTAGDNILPRFHPYFKRYIQISKMGDILDIVTSLVEPVKPENNRATPLSHQGRAPLSFTITNKFGVSSLITMLVRTEYLISSNNVTDKQLTDWSNFLISWAESCIGSSNIAIPLELISSQTFNKHCNRIVNLPQDKKLALERWFVDTN